jgi:glyoxylate/hydroxypyruvate/2-ketogluconate reductase
MNKPKVFISRPIPADVEDYIGKFCDYEIWNSKEIIPKSELFLKLKDKDGLLLSGIEVNEEMLSLAPNLRVISTATVGYDHFDTKAMKTRNIIGTNTPHVLDDTVADLIIGLILSAARRIPELDKYVKDGKWISLDERPLYGVDVHHSTIGIIGMGRIGEVVAKRAKFGFDAKVIYYNRNRKPDVENSIGVEYCELNRLLESADFIVLMTPYTSDTYHLIDFEEFSLMKNTAIFINASRGQTVNEEALIEALQNKKILGAGLDVYEQEPISPSNPLLKIPNAVTVPHIGSATEKTAHDMAMLAAENLVKALLEGTAPNIVPELRV